MVDGHGWLSEGCRDGEGGRIGTGHPVHKLEGVHEEHNGACRFRRTGSSDVTLSKIFCTKVLDVMVSQNTPASQGYWRPAAPPPTVLAAGNREEA